MFLERGDHEVLEDEKGCGFIIISVWHKVLPYTTKFPEVFEAHAPILMPQSSRKSCWIDVAQQRHKKWWGSFCFGGWKKSFQETRWLCELPSEGLWKSWLSAKNTSIIRNTRKERCSPLSYLPMGSETQVTSQCSFIVSFVTHRMGMKWHLLEEPFHECVISTVHEPKLLPL